MMTKVPNFLVDSLLTWPNLDITTVGDNDLGLISKSADYCNGDSGTCLQY